MVFGPNAVDSVAAGLERRQQAAHGTNVVRKSVELQMPDLFGLSAIYGTRLGTRLH